MQTARHLSDVVDRARARTRGAGRSISRADCEEMQAFGKSKRGLTNGGLSPKFSEKIGQKSFRENRAFSGLIGAFSGPIGAFSGLIGTDSSAPHSRGEAAKVEKRFSRQKAWEKTITRLARVPGLSAGFFSFLPFFAPNTGK